MQIRFRDLPVADIPFQSYWPLSLSKRIIRWQQDYYWSYKSLASKSHANLIQQAGIVTQEKIKKEETL